MRFSLIYLDSSNTVVPAEIYNVVLNRFGCPVGVEVRSEDKRVIGELNQVNAIIEDRNVSCEEIVEGWPRNGSLRYSRRYRQEIGEFIP